MPLTTTFELMRKAEAEKKAIPAFNIDNLESAIAVCEIIRESGYPVIIQMIPRTLNYGGIGVYPAIIKELLSDCDTDFAIHLDHGSSLSLAVKCIDKGFTSVMFDGSTLPFNENIRATKEVTDYALPLGISVEGELGTIGGKEEGDIDIEETYTKVDEAVEFTEKTGVTSLAIGVGTAHGIYKGTPHINVNRIREIHSACDTPLVLHGASGLSDSVLRECISAGISKINFATELRQAFTGSVRNSLENDKDVFDPKLYMRFAIDEIKKVLAAKIKVCQND